MLWRQLADITKADLGSQDQGSTCSDEESNYDVNSSVNKMSNAPKLEFRLNSTDWETFLKRFEIHFTLKKIEDATTKAAILLTQFDEEAYTLVKSSCAPDKPATKSLPELMSHHLNPKSSEIME